MRKVTEAEIQVLDQDAELLNRLKIRTDLLQAQDIEVSNGATPAIFGLGTGSPDIFFRTGQDGLSLLNRCQLGIELGDEAISLGQREHSLMLSVFVIVRHGVPPPIPSFITPLFCAATSRRQMRLVCRGEYRKGLIELG